MFLFLIACVGSPYTDELEDAEQRWADAAIDAYTYELTWRCFCPAGGVPVAIEVQGGEVVAATPAEPLDEVPDDTVPDLFAIVSDAIASEPDSLDVTYDATLGYPTRLDVDPMVNALDEEYGFEARDLAPVE